MGIDYSLCLVTRRNDADVLLARFSELLDPASRERLAGCKWTPESETRRTTLIGTVETDARGISGVTRTEHESSNSYCFAFHIQLEHEMEQLLGEHHFNCFIQPSSFGCMWTSIFAGDKFLLLESTAATSGMSRVIQHSKAIHAAWVKLAKESNAIFAYVDLEDEIALQLFPTDGDLSLPDYNTLAYDCDHRFSVDRMAEYLLATNGG